MTAKQQRTATKPPPKPRWPYGACPKGAISTAADILNSIVIIAARRGAKNLDRISMLVIECAALMPGSTDAVRCEKLQAAWDYADAGAWSKVATTLEALSKGRL